MEQAVEVMRVIRVPPLGKLEVQVGASRYAALKDVEDEATRHLLTAAIGELVVFTDGYETLVRAGVAPPLSAGTPDADQVPSSMEERRTAFLAELERQRDAARAASAAAATASVEPVLGSPDESSLSIIGQIDHLLQKQLAASPELSGRSIHLEGNPAGGLRIKVDDRYYEKPSEVEDPAIQQAIVNALREWDAA